METWTFYSKQKVNHLKEHKTTYLKHLLFLAILVSINLLGSIPAISQGTDVTVSATTAPTHNEVSLAILPGALPGSPAVLLCGYNTGGAMGFSRSTNGGATWTSGSLTIPTSPAFYTSVFDPAVGFDIQGNAFYAHVATTGAATAPSALVCFVSADTGTTWAGTPTVVSSSISAFPIPSTSPGNPTLPCASGSGTTAGSSDPTWRFNDRCQLVVDITPSSSFTNNVYIAAIQDRGYGTGTLDSDVYFWRSINSGTTFTGAINSTPFFGTGFTGRINDQGNNFANVPIPAVASNGTVYVAWLEFDQQFQCTGSIPINPQSHGTIWVDQSTDGGVNFGIDVAAATAVQVPQRFLNTGNASKSFGGLTLAVSPNNPLELYIIYAENPGSGDLTDIMFIRSIDGAATWSTPVLLTDEPVSDNNDQHLPWIEARANGILDAMWYDRRNDVNNLQWDVMHSISIDGGLTWSTNVAINDVSFNTPTGPNDMGEYLGLASDNTTAYAIWTSNLTSDPNGVLLFDKINLFESEQAFITDPAGVINDRLGNFVALSEDGNTLVAGNPDVAVGTNTKAGTAFVYERNAGGTNNWGLVAKLQQSNPRANKRFSDVVDISEDGSTIVVSALREDSVAGGSCLGTCTGAGAAFVYVRPGTSWSSVSVLTETAKLVASNAIFNDFFGFKVSISGNTVTVSTGGGAIRPGQAYIFVEPAAGWGSVSGAITETRRMINSSAVISDGFGISISIDGNTFVVGSSGQNTATGAAYVFVEPSGGWGSGTSVLNQSAKLTNSTGTIHDFFGQSVTIKGDLIAVGSPFYLPHTDNKEGSVYAFKKPNGGWSGNLTEEAKLIAPDGTTGDEFGNAVSLSGTKLLIGAIKDSDLFPFSGSAYIFDRNTTGSSWSFVTKLTGSVAGNFDGYGGSVSLSGNISANELAAAIAAPFNLGRGSIYMYTIPCVIKDSDGDGIADQVDSLPNTFSNGFTDVVLGGKTLGTITQRGGRTWQIYDDPGNGVRITASGGSTSPAATVVGNPSPCVPLVTNVIPAAGSSFKLSCGSVTIESVNGTVESTASAGNITVTAFISAGNIITFDTLSIDSMTVTSSANSISTILLSVNGNEFSLAPGSIDTITICFNIIADAGPDQTVYLGYAPNSSVQLQVDITGGATPFFFQWTPATGLSNASIANPLASPTTTTNYTVTATDLNGCVATDSVTVCVIDVRCGKKNNKVLVCHSPPGNGGNANSICISASAVAAHLDNHGDNLGPCGLANPCASSKTGQLIYQNQKVINLEAYPNPFSNSTLVTFTVPHDCNVTVEVFSLSGIRMVTIYNGEIKVNEEINVELTAGDLSPGIYMIRLNTSTGGSINKKLILY